MLVEDRGIDKGTGQKQNAIDTKQPSADLVPPFIRFLRRNEEVLAKRVSQLSVMLREAKGKHTALAALRANREYLYIIALTAPHSLLPRTYS